MTGRRWPGDCGRRAQSGPERPRDLEPGPDSATQAASAAGRPAPAAGTLEEFATMPAMSPFESAFCRGAGWRAFASRIVLPWALLGQRLDGDVLEIGGGSGAIA